jgi:uroporphyrinogen III methyltransferase/synthase
MGTRDSRLSIAQTQQSIERLSQLLPGIKFELVANSSPGDRDRETDLRCAPADFFTRDLDMAVITRDVDCAIHSAKDLPDELDPELDFVYLPWSEDPRDVLILPAGKHTVPDNPRAGISSQRREEYCLKRFPGAIATPIRGNIDSRIEQLDSGKYDLLIMAAAGLKRIGLEQRINEYIELAALPTPPGQGRLAVTFRKNNPFFTTLRKLFVNPVIFAGAGTGSVANVTLGVANALKTCEVCFYDALCPGHILELVSPAAELIAVGKRAGNHACPQSEINARLVDASRRGLRIVRLKGGDPGIFGRLAEETAALDEYHLPYRVLPGISSLNAATTATGLLLTRRNVSRGFTVATPRQADSGKIKWFSSEEVDAFPHVYFMASSELQQLTAELIAAGSKPELPVAVVFDAGSENEQIYSGTLADIAGKVPDIDAPGLIITGTAAGPEYLFKQHGALDGMRVMFAGSKILAEKAGNAIVKYGGRPVLLPMIELKPVNNAADVLPLIPESDWIIITSPSAAEIFLNITSEHHFDMRHIPSLAVCGPGTARIFHNYGIYPQVSAEEDFSSEGLIKALHGKIIPGQKVLRLRSSCAGSTLCGKLEQSGANVTDFLFYVNVPVHYPELPEFDAVLFTSASSVDAFIADFSPLKLENKLIGAIGNLTAARLREVLPECKIIISPVADVEAMTLALAAAKIEISLQRIRS